MNNLDPTELASLRGPDTPNLSDAILLALYGPGKLRIKGEEREAAPPKKARAVPPKPRRHLPRPAGIIAPPGVSWHTTTKCWVVQVSIRHRMQYVCHCPPTQAGADLAGELVHLARQMRDAGDDLAAIRAAVAVRRVKGED